MKHSQVWGRLSLIGGLTAVLLLIAFTQTGWGAPGTAVYQTYELLYRLLALPFDLAAFFGLNAIFLMATILAITISYNLLRVNRNESL